MKLSKTGLILAGWYVIPAATCIYYGYSDQGDPKGSFVLKQIPIVLQMAAADSIGLGGILEHMSWIAAYIVFIPLTVIFLYFSGYFLKIVTIRIATSVRKMLFSQH